MLIKTTPTDIIPEGVNPQTMLPNNYLQKRPFEKHRLTMVSRKDAADAAQLALFQLQDIPQTEIQVLGIGVLFATFCNRIGMDAEELYHMSMRVLREPTEGDVATSNSLQVLRDFAGIRIMGDETVTFY